MIAWEDWRPREPRPQWVRTVAEVATDTVLLVGTVVVVFAVLMGFGLFIGWSLL